MNASVTIYVLILTLTVFVGVFISRENKVFLSMITWGCIQLILVMDVQGMGWVIVIFWMAFGIPLSMLYCGLLMAIKRIILRTINYRF